MPEFRAINSNGGKYIIFDGNLGKKVKEVSRRGIFIELEEDIPYSGLREWVDFLKGGGGKKYKIKGLKVAYVLGNIEDFTKGRSINTNFSSDEIMTFEEGFKSVVAEKFIERYKGNKSKSYNIEFLKKAHYLGCVEVLTGDRIFDINITRKDLDYRDMDLDNLLRIKILDWYVAKNREAVQGKYSYDWGVIDRAEDLFNEKIAPIDKIFSLSEIKEELRQELFYWDGRKKDFESGFDEDELSGPGKSGEYQIRGYDSDNDSTFEYYMHTSDWYLN